jgi:hypothetical protein
MKHLAKPLNITSGSFQIFSKIRGDIHKSRCTTSIIDTLPPVSKTQGANFATGTAGVVDSSSKFPTVIMTPVANSGNNIRLLAP